MDREAAGGLLARPSPPATALGVQLHHRLPEPLCPIDDVNGGGGGGDSGRERNIKKHFHMRLKLPWGSTLVLRSEVPPRDTEPPAFHPGPCAIKSAAKAVVGRMLASAQGNDCGAFSNGGGFVPNGLL
ncbi:hypothetical protein GN956_G18191 [Arapaima gigas]